MIDKFTSCHGCPDRFVGCRSECEGWQEREAAKLAVYAERKTLSAAIRERSVKKNRYCLNGQYYARQTQGIVRLKPDGSKYRWKDSDK